MYFMLGNIAFEPVNLTEFSEQHTAEFAEHAVLKGKPRLQAMGEKLNELNFSLRLHHTIGGVESRYQALLEAKAKQAALALIWGSRYKGDYVIVDISSTT
ncbi:phage tail protein, partial [Mannheimia haemolytica]